jgi:hypothetical protein
MKFEIVFEGELSVGVGKRRDVVQFNPLRLEDQQIVSHQTKTKGSLLVVACKYISPGDDHP